MEGFGGAGTSLDADGVRVVITAAIVSIIVATVVVAATSTGQGGPPGEANTASSSDLTVDVGLSTVLQDGHSVSSHRH